MEETSSVFWVDQDTCCTADWGFHCRVSGNDWHPICTVYYSTIFSQWDYCYCY